MNGAALKGMRDLWSDATAADANGPTKTAVEMALTSHRLTDSGEFALLYDGSVWIWSDLFRNWSLYRTGRK
jgi:hypothetical protein